MDLNQFKRLLEEFAEREPDKFAELMGRVVTRSGVTDKLLKELEHRTGRRDLLKLGLLGLLSLGAMGTASAKIFERQPDGSYAEADFMRKSEYDSDLNKIIDLTNLPSLMPPATFVVAASDSVNKDKADYICNGVDDQVEIQAAINALPASGGCILLLEGTYNISATITILKSNVTLAGVGRATKLFLTNGANCHVIQVGDGATALKGITVRDLQIDGNKANQTDLSFGIYFYGTSGYEITNSAVINCYVYGCFGIGIYLNYANNNTIVGNWCNSNGYGIELVFSNNNTITGNQCNSNNDGIYLSYSNNNTITGNQSNSNSYYGIYLSGSNNNVVIGNQSNSNTNDGIYIYSSDYNTITGNRCTGNGNYGINVADADCNANYIGKNYLTGNTTGSLNNAGTGTYLGVPDTTNNIDNVV